MRNAAKREGAGKALDGPVAKPRVHELLGHAPIQLHHTSYTVEYRVLPVNTYQLAIREDRPS